MRTPGQLRSQLKKLETSLEEVRQSLITLGTEERLPGTYLVVECAGRRAVISANAVQEVVPLVAASPIPGAPPFVLGTILYRGTPVTLIDLAVVNGEHRTGPAPLDVHVLVMAASSPVALVVDRVRSIVEAPLLVPAGAADEPDTLWKGSPLVAGHCRLGTKVLPLLTVEPLLVTENSVG